MIKIDNDKIEGNGFLRTCPVCGFSFKAIDQRTNKVVKECPMCGHHFKDPDIFPQKPNDIDPRTFY